MNNGMAMVGNSCEAKRESEVKMALHTLRNAVERYDCLVAKLGSKIDSVLLPAAPACSDAQGPGFQTSLASEINHAVCQLRNINDNLESMVERIEL